MSLDENVRILIIYDLIKLSAGLIAKKEFTQVKIWNEIKRRYPDVYHVQNKRNFVKEIWQYAIKNNFVNFEVIRQQGKDGYATWIKMTAKVSTVKDKRFSWCEAPSFYRSKRINGKRLRKTEDCHKFLELFSQFCVKKYFGLNETVICKLFNMERRYWYRFKKLMREFNVVGKKIDTSDRKLKKENEQLKNELARVKSESKRFEQYFQAAECGKIKAERDKELLKKEIQWYKECST